MTTMPPAHDREIKSLVERVIADRGGAFVVALAYLGDRLGLFRAMAGAGALNSRALAEKTGLAERYVREWLRALAAAEYLDHDPAADTYHLTDAQATVFTDESHRSYIGGAFQLPMATFRHMPRFLEIFREGGGLSYDEMGPEISEAHDRAHRSMFEHQLAQEWLPAVPELAALLEAGISVLDVGCGLGRSSLAMARAYPRSRICGLEPDAHSISRARELAGHDGRGPENLEFLQSPIGGLPPGSTYDFILAFDCIHDMADPVGGLRTIRETLAPAGLFVWAELNVSDKPLENRSPIGRMVSGISLLHCMTASLAQGGVGLGALIGEDGARSLAGQAGFSHFEKVPIQNPLQQFFALRA